jgi:hypothetical protein
MTKYLANPFQDVRVSRHDQRPRDYRCKQDGRRPCQRRRRMQVKD